jgi:hypothetical protein
MFGIRGVGEHYAKIINDKGEHEVAVIMFP